MDKKKRPCDVNSFIWNSEKKQRESLVFSGLFHEWGKEIVEYTDSSETFTVGIIEDESGQIFTVNPNCIKFTDKK